MLQTYSSPQQSILYEDPGEKFDPTYLIGILRRKYLFFVIPFLVVSILGFAFVESQRPIYRSEGKILVDSPEIPPDLVRPTITELAEERVQVIQQRIMAKDSLLAVVNKYNLFPNQRAGMSETQLLDLIRSRTDIKPIEPDPEILKRETTPTIAFTLSFDYEVPDLAMQVANDFLTAILNEDAATRNKNAAATTEFLEREVDRLENEHNALVAQIVSLRQRATEQQASQQVDLQQPEPDTESDEVRLQKKNLSDLEAELAQKAAVYSDEHPVIKNLKRTIEELKRLIAAAPKTQPSPSKVKAARPEAGRVTDPATNVDILVLERQELDLEKSLEDANRKLNTARLGESMERGQEGERLQVIEQPSLPQTPIWPKKLKWLMMAFALACIMGTGCVILAETFDNTIRGSRELSQIVDPQLIVNIPYVSVWSVDGGNRRNFLLLSGGLAGAFSLAAAFAMRAGHSFNFSWLYQSRIDSFMRLFK